jgi:Ca2+-binding EF-hand superfamily protein
MGTKGYITPGCMRRVLDNRNYNLTDQEISAMQTTYPEYFKQDRIYYEELIIEMKINAQKSNSRAKKKVHKEKNFRETLETIKRRMDFDPGMLADELMTVGEKGDEMV